VSEAVQPADEASDGTSVDSGAATGAVGTETPPGFVPVTELERERQRAREFQSRYDQLIAEREQMNRSNGDGATGGQGEDDNTPGFDPDSFRQSVLTDVLRAQQMASGVQQARADFPHADPTLFTPERVAQFGSVESFRFAAEESHRRVASILDSERSTIEAQVREELGLQGGGAGGPQGETPAQGGDPTPEQLAAMTMGEWDDLERESPGIIERVLTRAGMQ
jgi:hypothetical protein